MTVKYVESDTPEGGEVYLTPLTIGHLVSRMAPAVALLACPNLDLDTYYPQVFRGVLDSSQANEGIIL